MTRAPTGPRLANWLGPGLARVRLHAIERRVGPGGARLIAKRRRWFAPGLIPPGNLYLRWLGAGVVVLDTPRWHARERAIHRALHGLECHVDRRGWLVLPEWPGATLAAFAADDRVAPRDRLDGLAAAGRSLARLHRVRVDWPGDPHGGVGHGDATLRNVRHDPATGRAWWFDFDTMHRPALPPVDRRADDLRTLLYSALEAAADLPPADIHAAIRAGYPDELPWQRLANGLRRGPVHFSAFHLAQAHPPRPRMEELEARIVAR